MKEYMVREYFDGKPAETFVLNEKEMFELLDDVKDSIVRNINVRKIAVFEIGECFLDWS